MSSPIDTRRYLSDFDAGRMGHILTDVLVIGSGVAGCRAAVAAAEYGSVLLLTKNEFEESATRYAQGGIAAALGANDTPTSHFEDTLRVGCGLCRADAVRLMVEDAPLRIQELVDWGIELDRCGEGFDLAREGGHSHHRIVHAHGDQTGPELSRTLTSRVKQTANVRVFEHCFLIDLITHEGRCVGAVSYHARHGHQIIWAKQVVMASGGCGQLWRETTNPAVATGDGVAVAFRAGVRLRDMEMMQFHPTTLYVAGAGRALITEALRGGGAYLVDRDGHRFMAEYHPDGELAPRDVVSRSIHMHLRTTRSNCVYLDARHIERVGERFPQIARLCSDFQIDMGHDLIPVRPSAHYLIGGIEVDLEGCTTLPGLLACGETACTGVHGANRLASNSLLEGLVFGRRAGALAGERAAGTPSSTVTTIAHSNPSSERTALDLSDIENSLRSIMWRNVGIVREGERLHETCDILNFWGHFTLDKTFDRVSGWEMQNKLMVAKLVAASALQRRDSIGVHFRSDAEPADDVALSHVCMTRSEEGTQVTQGT